MLVQFGPTMGAVFTLLRMAIDRWQRRGAMCAVAARPA